MNFLKPIQSTIILFFLALLSVSNLSAQDTHVPNQLMVQLDKHTTIERWIDKQNYELGTEIYSLIEKVSAPMNIYLLTFNSENLTDNQILFQARSAKNVSNAQFNHYVNLRVVPDDAQYNDQWQYNNTGQSGGTPGADIDIESAWDITTGGLTTDGDEIVVCVIDDGIDNDHEDIEGNLWVNEAEVPNNGVDDDGNGFVDDYRGWDTGSSNDAVYDGGGHGTPVAGCVGAKGDNGVGVAGVNWDVKLMIVQGGTGVESEVLEAYSYPLVMRQMYNASNGEEGAFVVATNASWGVDFGQPEDAPLWCAMYDTLGTHGVLNCGATINGNQNVDEIGDLPTACPSDYMISVTNMNHFDEKVTGAGYGAETIDLGAFGAGTWTTASGNGYGPFGGTSGATPHVAGTVALLYSAPCTDLITLAKTNPQGAADIVKQAIFDGVDPNESLAGITTTGGRLNVTNAMDFLLINCGDCVQPYGVEVTDIIDIQSTVTWVQADSVETVDLEYSVQGTNEWVTIESVSSPYTLEDLTACTWYDIRLLGYCEGEPTGYSQVMSIETDGCCENPEQFGLTSYQFTEANFEWESVFAAESYNIRIRETGTSDWLELNTTETSYQFTSLIECTEYEVQMQLLCAEDEEEYTQSITFTTLGCGACTDFIYCPMEESDNDEEWIAEVTINDLTNPSGAGEEGYENFSGLSTDLEQGGTYDVSFTPGYSGQEWDEYFVAWIDFNHNGQFESNEQVFDAGDVTTETVTGAIEVPEDATLGITRFRVSMAYNGAPSECDLNSTFGETEDYCVNIVLATGIDELNAINDQWSITPNPANEMILLNIEESLLQDIETIDIMTQTGQLVQKVNIERINSMVRLDVTELASGMYFIALNSGTERVAIKKLSKL